MVIAAGLRVDEDRGVNQFNLHPFAAGFEARFDRSAHFVSRDEIHAARQSVDDTQTETLGPVMPFAVAKRDGAGPPATALCTAGQHADGMQELMGWIRLPMRGFTATGDDHAGSGGTTASGLRHGRSKMHQKRHPAEDAGRGIHQPNQAAERGLAAKVHHPLEWRMIVTRLAHLHERQPPAKMVHNLLIPPTRPPLDREVILPAGAHNPKWEVPQPLTQRGWQPALRGRQMNVAAKFGRSNVQPQLPIQVIDESMNKVAGCLVRSVDERVLAVDHPDAAFVFTDRRDVRIVLEKLLAGSPDVSHKPPGVTTMQIAHRRGEHQKIPRRLKISQNQLLRTGTGHGMTWNGKARTRQRQGSP